MTVTIWMLVFMQEVTWAASYTIKNATGTVGGSLDLQCPYKCSEKDCLCKVVPQHGCSDVETSTAFQLKRNKKRVLIKDDHLTVAIMDLKVTDSGWYRCQRKKNRPVVWYRVTVSSSDVNRGAMLPTSKGLSTESPASPIPARTVRNEITSNSVQSANTASDKMDPQEPAPDLLRPLLIAAGLFGLIFLGALIAWNILRKRRKSLDTELLTTDVSVGESNQHPPETLVNPSYVAVETAAAKEQAAFYTMIGYVPPSMVPEHFYEEIQGQYSDINSPAPPIVGQQAIDTLRNGSELHNTAENGGYSLVMAPVKRQGVL